MVVFFRMYYVEEKWEAVGRIVGRKTKKEKKKKKRVEESSGVELCKSGRLVSSDYDGVIDSLSFL